MRPGLSALRERKGRNGAPRIAFFGLFGSPNLGNEATFAAMLANLRERIPDADVVCIAPPGSKAAEWYGVSLLPMDPLPVSPYLWRITHAGIRRLCWSALQLATEPVRLSRAARSLADVDALVIPGTGIVDDFGQGPLDLPLHLLRWCSAARKAGAPVHCLSIGAGPVQGAMSRRIAKAALRRTDYRSYRDRASRDYMQKIGFAAGADPVYPDLAFSLPRAELPPERNVTWPPRVVGVGVMGYYGWNSSHAAGERTYGEYLATIKRFIAWLVERNHVVRIVTGDTRGDDRPANEIAQWTATMPWADRAICEPIRTYADVLQQIAACDVVVATRYHNVLLALLLERPAISIGYSIKNDALMEQFDLGSFCQSIGDFSLERLQMQFERMTSLPQPPLAPVRAANADFRARLEEQYDRLFGDPHAVAAANPTRAGVSKLA